MSLRKFCKRSVFLVFLAVVICSLLLSEWLGSFNPDANFYLLPTRAWELGVGVLLALTSSRWSNSSNKLANILSLLGAGLVFFAIFSFDSSWKVPGVWGLLPVLGTALIIAYARPDNLVGRALSLRPFVWIGLISYSAYLWHQPLFAFYHLRHMGESIWWHAWLLAILSLVLAYFSWRFVETPFRNKARFKRKHVFSVAILVSSIFITIGYWGHHQKGAPWRMSKEVNAVASFANDRPEKARKCLSRTFNYLAPPQDMCTYNQGEASVAIWGDSHAAAITETLAEKLLMQDVALIQLTHTSCPPVPGFRRSDLESDKCPEFNQAALDYLLQSDVETVILMARWSIYLEGTRFNNGEGGVEPGRNFSSIALDADVNNLNKASRVEHFGRNLIETVSSLLDDGKKIVLVYPVPEVGWNVPEYMAKQMHFNKKDHKIISTSLEVYLNRSKDIRSIFCSLENKNGVIFIDPADEFCRNNRCFAEAGSVPLYYDSHHLNSVGAKILVNKMGGK